MSFASKHNSNSAPLAIRTYGDPVLRQRCHDVTVIDEALRALADDMIATMYTAGGVGLAAPQVGIRKRMFVYDVGEGPKVLINPIIEVAESETWLFEEGCLSVPGMYFTFARPKTVRFFGFDLDENSVTLEPSDYLARVLQHEVDHLSGRLVLDHVTKDERKDALTKLRLRHI